MPLELTKSKAKETETLEATSLEQLSQDWDDAAAQRKRKLLSRKMPLNKFFSNNGDSTMGAIFEINFSIRNAQDKQYFAETFHRIHLLSKMLILSNAPLVKTFIQDPLDECPWLDVEDDCITLLAEKKKVYICQSDAQKLGNISYNFGKEFPTPAIYIGAVMAIISHNFPNAQINQDALDYYEEFNKGTLLARVINSAIKNPLCQTKRNLIRNDKIIMRIIDTLNTEFAIDNLKKEYLKKQNAPMSTASVGENDSVNIKLNL